MPDSQNSAVIIALTRFWKSLLTADSGANIHDRNKQQIYMTGI